MPTTKTTFQANPDDIEVYDVEFVNPSTGLAGDMSAAKLVGPWIRCDAGSLSAEFVWPSTGSPEGEVGLEVTNKAEPALTDFGTPVDATEYAESPNQPQGTANRTALIAERTLLHARPVYNRTSGGTGATLRCYVAVMR